MRTSSLIIILTSFSGGGWLMPNHYLPWPTAWGDGIAIAILLLLAAVILWRAPPDIKVSRPLLLVAVVSALVLLFQWLSSRIFFYGDAAIAAFYIALWLAAVGTGALITTSRFASGTLNALTFAWVIAAILSVAIALVQWTGALSLGIYIADLPPGARPFANVAQPNHFATICLIGLCSLLWLYERREVGRLVFCLAGVFLLFGMAMSQSRTSWLQLGLVLVAAVLARRFYASRLSVPQLTGLGSIFIGLALLWPRLCETLLLTPSRTLTDQMLPGIRLSLWRAMFDAISQEPWLGYGWQQVGSAQQRIALGHQPIGEYFDHSHNFLLDLLLWNGIPVGLTIAALLVWWLVSRLRAITDAGSVWLMVLAGGIVIHGLLEYALEYAYFLIPLGLVMGCLERLAPSKVEVLIPRKLAISFVGLLAVFFVWTATEYLEVEEAHRTLRLESARIGVSAISTPIQPRRLLNQLEAYQRFVSTPATPAMSPAELEAMRMVALRFGYAPVLFRYALAAGLNAQPRVARDTLDAICRIHSSVRCLETQTEWQALQLRYPQLSSIAAPPLVPAKALD
jgi:O-antigen ligase